VSSTPLPSSPLAELEVWDRTRLGEVATLFAGGLPDDPISDDDLLTVLWDDGGVVLADPDGRGMVAAVIRPVGDLSLGHVRAVVVDPACRRAGLGRRLLAGAEDWLAGQGVATALLAGEVPCYLWPGVDATAVGMLSLAEAARWQPRGSALNMSLPVSFRADPPDGVAVRRLLDDDDVVATRAFVAERWADWIDEFDRGIERGSVFAAWSDGEPVGFCCHSVNRAGWLGPMGTDKPGRGRGLGAALVAGVCRDLQIAGFDRVEICWVGPVRFYAKLGATVSRVWRTYTKDLVPAATD